MPQDNPVNMPAGAGTAVIDMSPNPLIEAYKAHVDRTIIRENLKLTPEMRFRNFLKLCELAEELRKSGAAAGPSHD